MTIADIGPEPTLDAHDARALTDQIKVTIEGAWHLIERAYVTRAWAALGYRSWDDYCQREFGTSRLRLPREERQEVVASLRESGLSIRAIAVAAQISVNTVQRDLEVSQSDTPRAPSGELPQWRSADDDQVDWPPPVPLADGQHRLAALADASDNRAGDLPRSAEGASRVTGVDGKSYAAARPTADAPKSKRRPLGATVSDATRELLRATERLTRITEDDRFPRNREEVHHQMPDLLSALDHAVQFVRAAEPGTATANEEARRWWAAGLNTLSDALADVAKSIEKEF